MRNGKLQEGDKVTVWQEEDKGIGGLDAEIVHTPQGGGDLWGYKFDMGNGLMRIMYVNPYTPSFLGFSFDLY